jgi:hypothetical protein
MRNKESISRDLEDLLIKSSSGGSRSTFMILFFLKTIVEILVDIRDQKDSFQREMERQTKEMLERKKLSIKSSK